MLGTGSWMSLHPCINHLTGENIVNNGRANRWKEPGFLNEFVSTASCSCGPFISDLCVRNK